MIITGGWDATHQNLAAAAMLGGQPAGYLTGTPDIVWTAADHARFPGAVMFDQSPVNTPLDETADTLDYENGAATAADLAPWAKAATASWKAQTARPGQRRPAVYMSRSRVTEVVNGLVAGGVTSGVGLHIADWSLTRLEAEAELVAQVPDFWGPLNPFPKIGIQYSDQGAGGAADLDVWLTSWLSSGQEPQWPLPARFSEVPRTVTYEIAWASVPGAQFYQYQAENADTGAVLVADQRVTSPSALLTDLTHGTAYRWRVAVPAAADGSRLASPWSPWRTFTA